MESSILKKGIYEHLDLDADAVSMHMHTCLSYICRFQQLELGI